MDVRLTAEQQQLRDAAAKLADDLGPGAVQDLADESRIARLDKQIEATGWRSLRSDGASGVEVAIVAEEFGRRLVDAPFLGPVLADDLARRIGTDSAGVTTIAVDDRAIDARGYQRALLLSGTTVLAVDLGAGRRRRRLDQGRSRHRGIAGRPRRGVRRCCRPMACARAGHHVGGPGGRSRAARTPLACDYAKIREQYGKAIGSYQAVAHLLAESLALIEGSVSVLRHAAWAVDELAAGRSDSGRPGRQGLLRARHPHGLRDRHAGARRHRQYLGLPGACLSAPRTDIDRAVAGALKEIDLGLS